jgi:hypothetical protein
VRGCVSVLVLAAAFALAAAWFGGPPVAGALVEAALAGSGLEGRGTTVAVAADPPFEVLSGRADRVVIGTHDARFGDLEATRVDLALGDVDLVGRSFATVDGTLDGVRIRQPGGSIPIRRIVLNGRATEAEAVLTMAGGDVEALAADAVNDVLGLPIAGAELLGPDLLRLRVVNQSIDGRFVVEPDGSLALALPLPGTPRIPLVQTDRIEFESVTVLDGELVLTGTLDVTELVGG